MKAYYVINNPYEHTFECFYCQVFFNRVWIAFHDVALVHYTKFTWNTHISILLSDLAQDRQLHLAQ